ncbi:hypothetical protein NKH34_12105 [Mesorhizobium sp. M1148]|uniref:hypothetical protein n=1 Tax=unclassified Mesorhizobium TaxID=325217 RepID=UPI003337DE95
MSADWISLTDAAGMLAAAIFEQGKGITPTARRAYAAQHIIEARKMIERLWRNGTLTLRAGRIETLSDKGSTDIAIHTEIDPRSLDDAFFHEPEVLSELGSDGARFKATDISVSRPDLEEWLAHTTRPEKATKAEPTLKPERRGRKQAADWEAYFDAFKAKVQAEGYPDELNVRGWNMQADVERWVTDLLESEGASAGVSTVRTHVQEFLERIRSEINS